MTFGENLKAARKKRRLTQGELAAKMGSSKQAVSYHEQDRRTPDIYQAVKYARVLRVSIAELTRGMERPAPPDNSADRTSRPA